MPNLNLCQFLGNTTRAPEVTYTPKGTAIAKFGLAINRQWKDESGKKHEEVTFVDIEAFGKQAETLGEYVGKGDPLYVQAHCKQDSWVDKQTNEKRYKTKFVLDNFQFLKSRAKSEGGEQQEPEQQRPQSSGYRTAHSAPKPPHDPDLDAPF